MKKLKPEVPAIHTAPMKIVSHLKTYHDGANEERSCILAKIRRMQKDDSCSFPITMFINWLLDRDKRYKKKAGGL